MGYFPLFIDLSGRDVLLAGGGRVAERKARALLRFGAAVRLISPEITPGLRVLAETGALRFTRRACQAQDLDGAALAVAATGDRAVNRQLAEQAAHLRIPINVVDDPELCTFYFPALVQRGDLVIGVTTSGGFPALARETRRQIEQAFPPCYETVTAVLRDARAQARAHIPDPKRLRAALDRMLAAARQAVGMPPDILSDRLRQTCMQIIEEEENTYAHLHGRH